MMEKLFNSFENFSVHKADFDIPCFRQVKMDEMPCILPSSGDRQT
jgi:hypothetical protein